MHSPHMSTPNIRRTALKTMATLKKSQEPCNSQLARVLGASLAACSRGTKQDCKKASTQRHREACHACAGMCSYDRKACSRNPAKVSVVPGSEMTRRIRVQESTVAKKQVSVAKTWASNRGCDSEFTVSKHPRCATGSIAVKDSGLGHLGNLACASDFKRLRWTLHMLLITAARQMVLSCLAYREARPEAVSSLNASSVISSEIRILPAALREPGDRKIELIELPTLCCLDRRNPPPRYSPGWRRPGVLKLDNGVSRKAPPSSAQNHFNTACLMSVKAS